MTPAVAGLEVDIVVEQLRREVPGGIGTYCRGLLAGLGSLDAADRPAVTLRASRNRRGQPDPLAELGWPVRTSLLPGKILTRVWDRSVPLGWLGGPSPRHPEVVHATSFAAPMVRDRRLVVMVHDLAWRRFPEAYPSRGRAWHEAALERIARHGSEYVVPSELTARDLLGAGAGIREERVHVIAEGVDHLAPPDVPAARALLDRAGVSGEGYLLAVSTLEPRKNLHRLLDAYERARPRLQGDWPLIVAGPKGWGDPGAIAARSVDGVIPVGTVAGGTLSALFGGARCVAYVPLFEGFGLPAGEAMAAGAPVVATAGLPSSAGACLEVDPTDIGAIADALVLAAGDGIERDALLAAGSRRAAELRWSTCAERHVEVWQGVA